jgi:hypothetical protein
VILNLGGIISRTFALSWRHKWLWVLGVFGGAEGGFSFRGNFGTSGRSSQQVGDFIRDNLPLILGAAAVVAVVAIALFLVSCIAVPASIHAALKLDGGQPVSLGSAWSYGLTRFWAFLRLQLLKLAITLLVALIVGLLVGAGILVFAAMGPISLAFLIPLAIVVVLAVIAVAIVLGLGLAWSDRTLVLLHLGAVDSIRSSWWLFTKHKLDTFVFALLMGLILFGIGLAILLGAVILAIPGGVLLGIGIASHGLTLEIIGVVLLVLLAGVFLIVGAGYAGSLVQVSYALACRDLCVARGLPLAPEHATTPPAPTGFPAPA